jgi:hypothetical protein
MPGNPIVWWELASHDSDFDTGGGEWICLFNEPSGVTFAMIQEIPPAA